MGVHANNLAKHKIRAAQEHLKAALNALKDGPPPAPILQNAIAELEAAYELVK